jgi:hypothetical protein
MNHPLMLSCVRIILAAVVLIGAALPVHAEDILKSYAKPLPEIPLLPAEEFDAQTILYEDVPAGDEALSYKFRLPKDWKKPEDSAMTSYQISNKILGEIVRFYGPPIVDSRSFFSLQAINLEYQLTAQQWVLQYLLSNGYTIQGMHEVSKKRAEALYVKVENGTTYVIRAIAQMNGKRVVMAQYFMPADNWESEKQLQAQVMGTFELTHPVHEQVEEMTKYHFLDIAEFQYPVSWEFRAAPLKSADRMSFELFNIESEQKINWKNYKTLNGRIQVDIISYDSSDTVEAEIEGFKEALSKINLTAGEPLDTIKGLKFSKDVTPADVQVFKAMDTQSSLLNYEYWVVPLEAGEYYYFVSLITPAREEDYFVWARNTQTYELILELFQPLDEGLIYR